MQVRYFLCSLFVLLFVQFVTAQVLVPVGGNPAVELQASIQQKARLAHLNAIQWRSRDFPPHQSKSICATPDPTKKYAISGDIVPTVIIIDTTDNGGGSFTILPCNQFGTLEAQTDTTVSQLYFSNAGVELGFDTVCVRYCGQLDTLCDTLRFPIIVRRPGLVSDVIDNVLPVNSMVLSVLDTSSLVGNFDCDSWEQQNPQNGTVSFSEDGQLMYESNRFHGVDTVLYIYCDEFTICDTIFLAYRITGDTLDLPLIDEFSNAGPYPNPTLWLEDDGFVNSTFAYEPIGVGVLTLDGLTKGGRPWGTGVGKTDVLTSAYFDLSNLGAGNAYFNCLLQAGGNCDPVELGDSLVLEFKNVNNEWVRVNSWKGDTVDGDYVPKWRTDNYIIIQEPGYKFKGFQFRFINYGDQTGILDPWHLDYVRLTSTPIPNQAIGDIAFAKLPPVILKRYSSMPWRQFDGYESLELRDSLDVSLYSHFGTEISITDSRAALNEISLGNTLFSPPFVLVTGNVAPDVIVESRKPISDFAGYQGLMESLFDPLDSYLDFELRYNLVNNSQENQSAYFRNDTVRQHTYFQEYMSYDDGSAERAIIADAANSQLAMRYNLNETDSLRAIQIMLPRINTPVGDQFFLLRAWVDTLDETPEYERIVLPYYPDTYYDTLQGFTTYVLDTPILVPAGRLFVGWQQMSNNTNSIPVGFDVNYPDANQYAYFYNGQTGVWFPLIGNPNIQGAIMIRPYFGETVCTPCPSSSDDQNETTMAVRIHPNPTRDLLFLRSDVPLSDFARADIRNVAGQLLWSGPLSESIDVQFLSAGFYFLRVWDAAGRMQVLRFIKS